MGDKTLILGVDDVVVAARSGVGTTALRSAVPGSMSVRDAIAEVCRKHGQDESAGGVIAQLQRELAARSLDFYAERADGGLEALNPKSRVMDVAVPQEIVTPRGLQTIKTATIAVQSYADVGQR